VAINFILVVVSDPLTMIINYVQENKTLVDLNIGDNNIGVEGARAIAGMLLVSIFTFSDVVSDPLTIIFCNFI
jgi:hypothetical protein